MDHRTDKSRMNTAIYRDTYERLDRIARATGETRISLMDQAIIDLEKKILGSPKKPIDRQTDR